MNDYPRHPEPSVRLAHIGDYLRLLLLCVMAVIVAVPNPSKADTLSQNSSSESPTPSPPNLAQPPSCSLRGDVAVLQIDATGEALSFQWYRGISGDTTHPVHGTQESRLLIAAPISGNVSFWVRVSNEAGTVDSMPVVVEAAIPKAQDLQGEGSAYAAQLGLGIGHQAPSRVKNLTNLRQASLSDGHGLFLDTHGKVWAAGKNDYGQLANGTREDNEVLSAIGGDMRQVLASYGSSLFLGQGGNLWTVGYNGYGQLGHSGQDYSMNPGVPILVATDVAHIAAGGSHTLFLKTNGSLWTMGSNHKGQLGENGYPNGNSTPVPLAADVIRFAASGSHSLFIKADGTLWGLGGNESGQLGDGTTTNRNRPILIANDVADVAAAGDRSFFIKNDGTLWAMGDNYKGQLGDGTTTRRLTPVQIASDVAEVVAGGNHTTFRKIDDSLWAMGGNSSGQLGDGTAIDRLSPVQMADSVVHVAVNSLLTLFVTADGSTWVTGDYAYPTFAFLDVSPTEHETPVFIAAGFSRISAGAYHNLLLRPDGTLHGMGNNGLGQLGNGTYRELREPTEIATDVARISAGHGHSLFVKSDGTLWGMGDNRNGQLGLGSVPDTNLPQPVASEVLQAVAGQSHSLFIKTDGSLWGMGSNTHGQLGDGLDAVRDIPIQIASDVAQAATGSHHTLFLKVDGTLWGLGANSGGQLGDGTFIDRQTPILIANDVVRVAAAGSRSLFIKKDGSLWIMGAPNGSYSGGIILSSNASFASSANSSSSGSGTISGGYVDHRRNLPVYLHTASLVADIAIENHSVFFLTTDDTLWSVTQNTSGNFQTTLVSPRVNAVSVGRHHSLRLTPAARVVTFDSGSQGEIYHGPREQRVIIGESAVPPLVSSLLPDWVFSGWDTDYFNISDDVTITAIYKRKQVITFPEIPKQHVKSGTQNTHYPLASTSSGLPVNFTVVSGPAKLGADGRTLTLTDAGSVTIRADQPGDSEWAMANPVTRTFAVTSTRTSQSIDFPIPASRTYGEPAFDLHATASSGLPVTFELVSGPALLDSAQLTPTGAGSVKIKASQSGGAGFAAVSVTRTLTVKKKSLLVNSPDFTRLVTQTNPTDFGLTYSGFVPGDDASSLDKKPVGSTKATPKSPAGLYPITFSGGSDNNYVFASGDLGDLTVLGFGGSYETLLSDAAGIPLGKLELTVASNAFTYTGILHLASEPDRVTIASNVKFASSVLSPASDGSSATATWNRAANSAQDVSALSLRIDLAGDTLSATLTREGASPLSGIGSRLFTQALDAKKKKLPAPWTGTHTLILRDPEPLSEADTRALPQGSGHTSVTIAATGVMTIKGKLPDGATLTATARAATVPVGATMPDGHYRIFARPYGARLHSFFSGPLALEKHPDQTRFPGRFHVAEEDGLLFWAKAPLPSTTKPANQDKSYRQGFAGDLVAILDPWIAPATKPATVNGVAIPAGNLAQRLGLTSSPATAVDLSVSYGPEGIDLGDRANQLPVRLGLSTKNTFSVAAPVTTPPNVTKFAVSSFTASTGAFSGSFVLKDPAPTPTKPAATKERKVAFSGTLRQGPDGAADALGYAHFLLDPSVTDTSDEQISGELLLSAPPPAP